MIPRIGISSAKMTRIDDFVEKYESKIDKIKYRPVKEFVRGFVSGISLPGLAVEGSIGKGDLEKKLPSELYTLGWKNYARRVRETEQYPCPWRKNMAAYITLSIGWCAGSYLSIKTAFIPWIATGAIDLVNLYLKKKEKKSK
jgi:hypothetical protein